ncbi:STAS domain-containing protein [Hoyosella altamirensis]|uniref:Anti-anti-sigma regulatory factor n=1 Tax=Hoyosella altamirensis TaxID=616997 RepID=A0A839RSD8_9ACTN|nr:STAS domain-containing protein [Hoyosella altamirensis]MBB3038781.1 anti-anti-sigma regulatory factor [Hoyosella altamirensis]
MIPTALPKDDPKWAMTVTQASTPRGGVRVAVLQGELDASKRAEITEGIHDLLEAGTPVMLDLSQVRFCSVACIEAIARCATRASDIRVDFSIFAPRVVARCLALYEPTPHVITVDGMSPNGTADWLERVYALQAS